VVASRNFRPPTWGWPAGQPAGVRLRLSPRWASSCRRNPGMPSTPCNARTTRWPLPSIGMIPKRSNPCCRSIFQCGQRATSRAICWTLARPWRKLQAQPILLAAGFPWPIRHPGILHEFGRQRFRVGEPRGRETGAGTLTLRAGFLTCLQRVADWAAAWGAGSGQGAGEEIEMVDPGSGTKLPGSFGRFAFPGTLAGTSARLGGTGFREARPTRPNDHFAPSVRNWSSRSPPCWKRD